MSNSFEIPFLFFFLFFEKEKKKCKEGIFFHDQGMQKSKKLDPEWITDQGLHRPYSNFTRHPTDVVGWSLDATPPFETVFIVDFF